MFIADEIAIRQLCAAYTDAVVRGSAADAAAVYAPDGVLAAAGYPDVVGREKLLRHFGRLFTSFELAYQILHSPLVDIAASGQTAHVRCPITAYQFLADGGRTLLIGWYQDDLVKLDIGWRFARREMHYLYRGPADLSGRPSVDDRPVGAFPI
jgi:ketosteroid isomerase-like protein